MANNEERETSEGENQDHVHDSDGHWKVTVASCDRRALCGRTVLVPDELGVIG